jgi:hypothetical protein
MDRSAYGRAAPAVDNLSEAPLQSSQLYQKEKDRMAEPVVTTREGDVVTILLNRPESGNRQTDCHMGESNGDVRYRIEGIAADYLQGRPATIFASAAKLWGKPRPRSKPTR